MIKYSKSAPKKKTKIGTANYNNISSVTMHLNKALYSYSGIRFHSSLGIFMFLSTYYFK